MFEIKGSKESNDVNEIKMIKIEDQVQLMDVSLFDEISSETSAEDRRSLLLIQKTLRDRREYVYLEIGSHLGGSIQTHFADPKCKLIYSIDKRPPSQPDERGLRYPYPENSTQRMITNLQSAFPAVPIKKLKTFDCDASDLRAAEIAERPDLCFIDGEHTNKAVFSDFQFCLKICQKNAIIVFHDSGFIYAGIKEIKKSLSGEEAIFQGMKLLGSVYVILLNDAIGLFGKSLEIFRQDESAYWRLARKDLLKEKVRNKIRSIPWLYRTLRILQNKKVTIGVQKQ